MPQEGGAGEQWAVATGMAQPYLQFSLAVLLGPRSELAQVSETVSLRAFPARPQWLEELCPIVASVFQERR